MTTTVTCPGVKQPIQQSLKAEEDLNIIREEVLALHQRGREDIRVGAMIDYSFDRREEAEEIETPITSSRKRTRSNGKETATQRMKRQQEQDRALAVATNDQSLDLTVRYQCRDKTCTNYGYPCYKTKAMGHLHLTALDFSLWNEAIQRKRATLDHPPTEMIAAIMVRRAKAGAKKPGQGSPNKASSSAGNTYIIHGGGASVPGLAGHFGGGEPRSSPPLIEGSEVTNLKEYLGWLIRKGHLEEPLGQRARAALVSEGWAFSSLREVSAQEWEKMDIPRGAVVTIRQKQKVWILWKQKKAIADAVREADEVVDLDEIEQVMLLDDE